ncbi:hypothetical protein H0H93_010846 [Arthromyces matolae]|nr:hypothetical protein H0H93_010846 [Arthromyces matolae]
MGNFTRRLKATFQKAGGSDAPTPKLSSGNDIDARYDNVKSTLWRNNYPPSGDQRALLNEYLVHLQKDITALLPPTNGLEQNIQVSLRNKERKMVKDRNQRIDTQIQRRDECIALLSPCRLLPTEILSQIHLFAAESGQVSPRTFCSVCSSWRNVAMVSPSDWKNEYVLMSADSDGVISCTVDFENKGTQLLLARQALVDIAPFIPLISSISFLDPLCTKFLRLPSGMIPHLRHFQIVRYDDGLNVNHISVFNSAPSLKSVSLEVRDVEQILQVLPSKQLTHLDLRSMAPWDGVYPFLAQCPKLISLSLRTYRFGGKSFDGRPTPKQLTFPELLTLRLRVGPDTMANLLPRFRFRRPLTSLELLLTRKNQFYTIDYFRFFSQSLKHIQALCLSPQTISRKSIPDLVVACVSLQELTLIDEWYESQLREILGDLEDQESKLPLLRKFTLVFKAADPDFLYEAAGPIHSLILAWMKGDSHRQSLKTLSVVLEDPRGPDGRDAFMWLVDGLEETFYHFQGLVVTWDIVDIGVGRWYT